MSGNERRTIFWTVSVAILFAGCAGTPRPAVMYPQFQRATARPLVVLIDVALAHDVAGDIDELRLYEGRSVADSLAARLRERLSARSYRVDKAMLTSMGLTWTATPELLTLTSADQEKLAPVLKPWKAPPFFTNDSLASDTMALALVRLLYREVRCARWMKLEKEPECPVESASTVHRYVGAPEGTDLLAVLVSGRDVSTGKKAGRTLLTIGAIALGAAGGGPTVVPFWDNGGVMVEAFIVDVETGVLRWSDVKFDGGARANWATVAALTDRLVAELP